MSEQLRSLTLDEWRSIGQRWEIVEAELSAIAQSIDPTTGKPGTSRIDELDWKAIRPLKSRCEGWAAEQHGWESGANRLARRGADTRTEPGPPSYGDLVASLGRPIPPGRPSVHTRRRRLSLAEWQVIGRRWKAIGEEIDAIAELIGISFGTEFTARIRDAKVDVHIVQMWLMDIARGQHPRHRGIEGMALCGVDYTSPVSRP